MKQNNFIIKRRLVKNISIIIFLFVGTKSFGQQPRLVLPFGHTTDVTMSSFSPDGKRIVTSSEDNTAKIWDVNTGKLLNNLIGHIAIINFVKFSEDGKRVITCSNDKTAKIWEVNSGKLLLDLNNNNSSILTASFCSDKNIIYTISNDNIIKEWDLISGVLISEISLQDTDVENASIGFDNKLILTVAGARKYNITHKTNDNTIKLWDIHSSNLIKYFTGHKMLVKKAVFSADQSFILSVSEDGTAIHWEVSSGKIISIIALKNNKILSAEYSIDGKNIITVASNGEVNIWDANTGKQIIDFTINEKGLNSAIFNPNGKLICTISDNGSVKIWELNSKKIQSELKGYTKFISSTRFSPNEKNVIITSDSTANVWDLSDGKQIFSLVGHHDAVNFAEYSPDGNRIVTASSDNTAKIWDARNGNILYTLNGHKLPISTACFSSDGKMIVTASWDNTARIWDVISGKLLFVLKGHKGWVYSAYFDNENNRVVTSSGDETAKIWNVKTGNCILTLNAELSFFPNAKFSPDGKRILTFDESQFVKTWDAKTGKIMANINAGNLGSSISAKFDLEGNQIITNESNGTFKIWDANSGKLIVDEKEKRITDLVFCPNNSKVIFISKDTLSQVFDIISKSSIGEMYLKGSELDEIQFSSKGLKIVVTYKNSLSQIWDAQNVKHLFSFFSLNHSDYFTQIPTGYYQCSPNAAKLLHYVTKELKIISFEQLDIKYNRPDKVLEALGNEDTSLIKSYRNAYLKRIKKLGIDTTTFKDDYSVPECDIANRDQIEYDQKDELINLHIKGNDDLYKLDRFNIWINEVPLLGQRGISIRKQNRNSLDTTITIKLSQGINNIEASIINYNGTESYHMPLVVNYIPSKPPIEKVVFLGIGIDNFANPKYNLQYSVKDIRDLAKSFKTKYGNSILIDTFFNEQVTTSNIKSIKANLLKTSIHDKVIIAYSGHGVLTKEFDYYLSTYDVDFENASKNGLSYEDLEWLIDSIPARKKLLLIDACHSGEVDKEELAMLVKVKEELDPGSKGSTILVDTSKKTLSTKSSFELMQNMFVNINKGTGATIISASGGTQFALERGDLKNGVFTYSILDAFKNNSKLKISELKKIVGDRVVELTKGMQKPTTRNETINSDWDVW